METFHWSDRHRECCHGAVAQLGERCVRNAEVVGSTPIGSNKMKACV